MSQPEIPKLGTYVSIFSNDFTPTSQEAVVEAIDSINQIVLLRLHQALKYKGQSFPYVIAKPRLERDRLVLKNEGILCAVTWVPEGKFNPNSPFDLSWWRGGAAAIADIKFK